MKSGNMENSCILIDACCTTNIVALSYPKRQLCFVKSCVGKKEPGENLLLIAESWMKQYQLGWDTIDFFVSSHGPGSLTGLRVAMSFVRTLAQIFSKPVVTLNSLWLLQNSIEDAFEQITTVIQARNDRYYLRESGWEEDCFLILSGEEVLKRNVQDGYFCFEEGCDLPNRFKNEFSVRQFVSKKINPETFLRLSNKAFIEKKGKNYKEVFIHYGGRTVAEEIFYKNHGFML